MKRIIIAIALLSFGFSQQTYDSEIQPIWDNSCTSSCHNSGNNSGGLNLMSANSYSELVNVASQGWPSVMRVKPGDNQNSVLFQKIVGNTSFGDRMPKGGTLSQADEDKIKKWIDEGAPQDWSGGTAGAGSYDFEVGDRVEVSVSEINGSSNFSVEFFVLFHIEPGEYQEIIKREFNDASKGHDFFFEYDASEKKFVLSIDGIDGLSYSVSNLMSGGLNNSGWHHIYFEYNNQDLNFFWNGNNVASVQNIPNLSFPTSSKPIKFENFKGSIDGLRIRNISGFEGIPGGIWDQTNMGNDAILVWNCNEILVDANINPDDSNQYLKDESGKNNHGLIQGNGQLDGDVFGGGGGGTQGIEVSYNSNNAFNGDVHIGYIPQGNDPNYWSSATHKWDLGNHVFPGDYWTKIWHDGIPDGEAHLIVFVDTDNDDQWNDATEYGAISQVFQVTNKQGNAGTLTLMKGGGGGGPGKPNTIEIVVRLNQNIGVGDVHVGVWLPGNNANPDIVGNMDVENSPSPNEGWGFEFNDSRILPSDGPYKIEAFFDQNNNDMPDANELLVLFQDIYTDDQGYAFVDMTLGDGGNQQQILNVSLSVDGVGDGVNGQVIIDLLRSSDEYIIQGFQFGETTPITNMNKSFNVTSQVNQNESVFLRGWYMTGGNETTLLAEGESNVFNWPPTGDISLVLEKGTYTGPFKTNITVHGTDESGILSFRILPQGSSINDYMPDFIGAEYSYDHPQVFSTPPSDEEIEINDFLIDVDYGMYPLVAWYNVGSDDAFDPAQDPFAAGQINIVKDQGPNISLTPLSILPGPEIASNNLIGLTPNEGEDLSFSINVNPHPSMLAGTVSQVSMIYFTGHGNFRFTDCSNSTGDTYDCLVPGSDMTNSGLVIGIDAFDEYGAESSAGPYDVAVQFDSIYISSVPAERYIMISVPANLSNPSLTNVLGDELGEADATKWRSFKWVNGAYQENAGSLTPGSAVWLISKENVNAIQAGSGYSTALSMGKTISLSNGWNQIGNPYNFPINIDDQNMVQFSSEVEKVLYQYSGGENYSQTTNLDPGTGYWVYSNGSGSINISPINNADPHAQPSSPNLVSKSQGGWQATLEVVAGNQKDKATIFGMHPESSDGYDKKDFHEPPVIGEYISAYFNHPETGNLNNDMRSESQDVTRWPLSVITNQKGTVKMTIPDIERIPNYFEVMLYDPISKVVYDMRQDNLVRISSQGSENPYPLELILGPFDEVEDQLDMMDIIPSTFQLAQNIPNPFNPVTSIRVSLTEQAVMTLKVYNILGIEMNALAVNQLFSKGNHRFLWEGKDDNGRQLPSGIYLYRLTVSSENGLPVYQDTKKMILMK